MHGSQRSLAFELTTAILCMEIHKKCALGARATMDYYMSVVIRSRFLVREYPAPRIFFLKIFKKNLRGTKLVREKLVLMITCRVNLLRYAEA